jgi:hypothetical protein
MAYHRCWAIWRRLDAGQRGGATGRGNQSGNQAKTIQAKAIQASGPSSVAAEASRLNDPQYANMPAPLNSG